MTESVYDSVTRRNVLIPQGARLMGRYNSQVSYGQRQSRMQAVWESIIMSDAPSIVLDNPAGADPVEFAGLKDDVDWHWPHIVVGAALTTLLEVGAKLAAPLNQSTSDERVIIVKMKKAPHMAGLLTPIVCPRGEALANKAQG